MIARMISYTGKFVLAPMVRIGELPTRLLALKHGADLVWGPELIDKKIIQCERIENSKLNTVDFVTSKNKEVVVFRTSLELEKEKVIFQMGTADPELAVKAGNIIIKDVAGIDINAGCPKHFSVHSGMGAALLSTPDLLCNILTSLVNEVGKPNNKPISVKIRLLPEKEDSLALVSRLVKTGITNLTLHCRTKTMRNREAPIRDHIPEIAQICRDNNVSFIINGAVKSYAEYKELQEKYGEDVGCMIAEAAEENASCFNPQGAIKWPLLTKQYIEFCDKFENHRSNTKYCLMRMIPNAKNQNIIYSKIIHAKEHAEFYDVLMNKMDEEGKWIDYANQEEIEVKENNKRRQSISEEINKKVKVEAVA